MHGNESPSTLRGFVTSPEEASVAISDDKPKYGNGWNCFASVPSMHIRQTLSQDSKLRQMLGLRSHGECTNQTFPFILLCLVGDDFCRSKMVEKTFFKFWKKTFAGRFRIDEANFAGRFRIVFASSWQGPNRWSRSFSTSNRQNHVTLQHVCGSKTLMQRRTCNTPAGRKH